jgi:Secretion system C-terminal sorting domain
MKLNNVYKIIFLFVVSVVLMSWGHTGHYHISSKTELSFNNEMEQFNAWPNILASHASDADRRKDEDPTEGPKHYIDIDNYDVFNSTGRIPQTYDSVIDIYGYSFVKNQGFLPWATLTSYDSLVDCFERRDWDKAVLFAADIGHYVADGHMPMHITANYNGQLTDNYGIHSRYESTMINARISEFSYEGMPIDSISDVRQYIFDYIYANYIYVDSVIEADDYATEINGDYYSSAYKNALWEKTGNFTIELFKNASHSITELIYTAWLQAGRPDMNATDLIEVNEIEEFVIMQNYPNPFISQTNIRFNIPQNSKVSLEILNTNGQIVSTIINGNLTAGIYNYKWNASNEKSGVYFAVLTSNKNREVRKLILLDN